MSAADDPVLRELREQISGADRAILDAVNTRLELVARVKAHKESRGIDFLDPVREQAMFSELTAANSGPLSDQGIRELLAAVLELTKREVSREPD